MEPTNRTPSGDQYSLGCILYFCLTGRVPFPEGSAVEKMMAHQTKEPMPIKELAPEVPDGLVAVVKKLMSKKPEDRYGACDNVVEVLEPYVGDLAAIPGGVPNAKASMAAMSGSNSRMAGLGQRGSLSNHGSGGRMAGLPSKAPVGSPTPQLGNRSVPPASGERAVPGRAKPAPSGDRQVPGRGQPAPSAERPGVGRTPPPAPPRGSVPSRSGMNAARSEPVADAPPRQSPPSRGGAAPGRPPAVVPGRGAAAIEKAVAEGDSVPLGWAEEEVDTPRKTLSPLVLVGVALVLMISVYIGATMLMNK
jgi:serine/threonine-protein kinase